MIRIILLYTFSRENIKNTFICVGICTVFDCLWLFVAHYIDPWRCSEMLRVYPAYKLFTSAVALNIFPARSMWSWWMKK